MLTKSQENYIKIIYELSLHKDGAHITDIATEFGVSKASASVAAKSLEKKGLVRRDIGRLVCLTHEGEKQAISILDKFSIIKELLVNMLGVDPQTAHTDACAMEHLVSPETLCAMCRSVSSRECNNGCTVSRKAVDAN